MPPKARAPNVSSRLTSARGSNAHAGPSRVYNTAAQLQHGDEDFPQPPAQLSSTSTGQSEPPGELTDWHRKHKLNNDAVYKHTKTNKLAQKLAQRAAQGELKSHLDQVSDEAGSVEAPRENPHMERKILAMLRNWAVVIPLLDPAIRQEDFWRSTTITKHAPTFLNTLFHNTEGRQSEHVKAISLYNWVTALMQCIIRYSRDERDRADGPEILISTDLYGKLHELAEELIKKYNLDRHQGAKVYYGRWELLLILSRMLITTEYGSREERVVKLQLGCLAIISFYIAARPGSLAPNCDENLMRDLFLLLGDIEINLLDGIYNARVTIKLRAWKGERDSVVATAQSYSLDAVTMAHNVVIDPTVWIITYLLCRGAFGEKYKTLEDLEAVKHAVLPIAPEKQKEPFFLATSAGGHSLIPGKAALASKLSENLKQSAIAAGLPPASMYAFRRDAGNFFSIAVSTTLARMTMGHCNAGAGDNEHGGATTVFYRNYSMGTAQVPYTGIRTEEIQGKTDEVTKKTLRMNDFMRAAVDAWVNISSNNDIALEGQDQNKGELPQEVALWFSAKSRLSDEGKLAVYHHPQITASREMTQDEWARFFKSFVPEAATHIHEGPRATATINTVMKEYPRRLTSPKEVYEAKASLEKVLETDAKLRRSVTRQQQRLEDSATIKEKQDAQRPQNTSEARADAVASLNAFSTDMLVRELNHDQPDASTSHPADILAMPPTHDKGGSGVASAQNSESESGPLPILSPEAGIDPETNLHEQPLPQHPQEATSSTEQSTTVPHVFPPTPWEEYDTELLSAPWEEHDNPDTWLQWQSTVSAEYQLHSAEEYDIATEYSLALDPGIRGSLVRLHDANQRGHIDSQALHGVNFAQRGAALMKSMGVPPLSEISDLSSAEADNVAAHGVSHAPDPQVVTVPVEETDVLRLPCEDVRSLFAHRLLAPIVRNERIEANYVANGNTWCCKLCDKFTHKPVRTWKNRAGLQYHTKIHTPWHDLELDMVSGDPNKWNCPANNCDYVGFSPKSVRNHCLHHCESRQQFRIMQEAHKAVNGHERTIEHRNVRLRALRNQGPLDDSSEFESDDDKDIALEVRDLFLSMRNWDVDEVIDSAISNGVIQPGERDSKREALKVLCDFSERAWNSPDFYIVPVKT